MKLYADRPARFVLQLFSDVLAIVWIAAWIRAAVVLHDMVAAIGGSGRMMAGAGDAMDRSMGEAAEQVRRVPVAGDSLAAPFSNVGEAGSSFGDAGRSLQSSVETTALVLALLVAALPVLLALATWLPARLRWIRQASAARDVGELAAPARDRLLALRALTTARPARLSAVHADPVAAWHADDDEAVSALAALELHRLGLRAPRE